MSLSQTENFKILAPLRLSLAGGGTDVEPFATEFGSKVLNFAINLRIEVNATVAKTSSKMVNLEIVSGGEIEKKSDFSISLARALTKRVPSGFSLKLLITNPVGPGSGLGTSSALIIACRILIEKIFPKHLPENQILVDSYNLERKEMMIEGGFQDFYPAMYGGINWLYQESGQSIVRRDKIVPLKNVLGLLSKMCVLDIGLPRKGEEIIRDQISRYKTSKGLTRNSLISQLRIANDLKDALIMDDTERLLQLIEEGYEVKKGFTPLITNPNIDIVESSLREMGARGIKISGAGGGGHMFCFFPGGIPKDFQSRLPAHTNRVDCEYTETGWKIERLI